MISFLKLKLEAINVGLNKIQGSVTTLEEHVSELELRVSSNDGGTWPNMWKHSNENSYLKECAEAAENRSQASSLLFISVPEKSQGLIQQLLAKENLLTPPVIEFCNCSLSFIKQNSSRHRPILVKFLYFQGKLKILKLSREKTELVYNGIRTTALLLPWNASSSTQ